jgi:hypothetical protein
MVIKLNNINNIAFKSSLGLIKIESKTSNRGRGCTVRACSLFQYKLRNRIPKCRLTNQKVEAIGLGLNCRFGKSHWSIHTVIFFCVKNSPPDEKSNLFEKIKH